MSTKPKATQNKAKQVETKIPVQKTDVEKMSLVELKALAYDILATIEQNNRNLQKVNNLIIQKQEQAK